MFSTPVLAAQLAKSAEGKFHLLGGGKRLEWPCSRPWVFRSLVKEPTVSKDSPACLRALPAVPVHPWHSLNWTPCPRL